MLAQAQPVSFLTIVTLGGWRCCTVRCATLALLTAGVPPVATARGRPRRLAQPITRQAETHSLKSTAPPSLLPCRCVLSFLSDLHKGSIYYGDLKPGKPLDPHHSRKQQHPMHAHHPVRPKSVNHTQFLAACLCRPPATRM